MASLTFGQTALINKFLGLPSGSVLDFDKSTLQILVGTAVDLNIFDNKYSEGNSGSKGKYFQSFMRLEDDAIVGKVLTELCKHYLFKAQVNDFDSLMTKTAERFADCNTILKIAQRLSGVAMSANIKEVFEDFAGETYFNRISQEIQRNIDENAPDAALDRLHTFMISFLRALCEKHKISFDQDTTLNALMGKYRNYLRDNTLFLNVMSEKIITFSLAMLESFNTVRNNYSMAHANELLGYDEALFIFNTVSNLVHYIHKIENRK